MKIQPIVEGHGEVSAVPVLLRRLLNEAVAFQLDVGSPIRRKRSELLSESELRKSVRLALRQEGCGAVLVLFDSDKDCPKALAPRLQSWARHEAGAIPCEVVMAHKEYEAWLLASVESLRGRRGIRTDAEPHADPESPRGAKSQLEDRMVKTRSYSETTDQAAFSDLFDLSLAYRRCRSFRRLASAFGSLLSKLEMLPEEWPPSSWTKSSGI